LTSSPMGISKRSGLLLAAVVVLGVLIMLL
jgi:hypothetical protein